MTVRVTTLKGFDAGSYYVEKLPNSYLDSGEPRGVWFGDGAQQGRQQRGRKAEGGKWHEKVLRKLKAKEVGASRFEAAMGGHPDRQF